MTRADRSPRPHRPRALRAHGLSPRRCGPACGPRRRSRASSRRGTSRSGRSRSTPTSWRSRSSRCASRARRASRCGAPVCVIPPSEMVVMLDPPRHGPVRRVANAALHAACGARAARRHRAHRGRDPRRRRRRPAPRASSTSSSGSRRRSRSRVIAWILGVPRDDWELLVPLDQRGDRQGRSGVPPARARRPARPSSARVARCTPTSGA